MRQSSGAFGRLLACAKLESLVRAGNTVLVVEQGMHVGAQSDWIIDMGPGAGDKGAVLWPPVHQHSLRA